MEHMNTYLLHWYDGNSELFELLVNISEEQLKQLVATEDDDFSIMMMLPITEDYVDSNNVDWVAKVFVGALAAQPWVKVRELEVFDWKGRINV